MTRKPKPPKQSSRSRRLEVLHKTAAALHNVSALDKSTMRDIDAFCLTKVEMIAHPSPSLMKVKA